MDFNPQQLYNTQNTKLMSATIYIHIVAKQKEEMKDSLYESTNQKQEKHHFWDVYFFDEERLPNDCVSPQQYCPIYTYICL